MSNFATIEQALVNSVTASVNSQDIEYPGMELNYEGSGNWYKMQNLRASSSGVTLGDRGEDEHRGILQIDINCPGSTGANDALLEADRIAASYRVGSTVQHSGQIVHFRNCSLSPGREVGAYYRVSLSINYYARTARN